MKRLGWRWVILVAFLLAASFAGLFAVRTVRRPERVSVERCWEHGAVCGRFR